MDKEMGEAVSNCLFIHGDARRLPIDLKSIDAIVSDPPYGVGFEGKNTKHTARSNEGYSQFEDTEEYVATVIVPIVSQLIVQCGRVVITPGIRNMHLYPKPAEVGGIYCPSGAGLGKWGFICFHPILYYGKCPYLAKGLGHRPNGFSSTESSPYTGHPCSKPVSWMRWLVEKASLPGELIVDPFVGSGSTGLACSASGRRFIGLDLDRKYLKIAKHRIDHPNRHIPRPGRSEHQPLFRGLADDA